MKLEDSKIPVKNPGFSRGYWEKAQAFTGAGENVTLELSPCQSWSLPRAHLISFHCHPNKFLELEFSLHTVVVWPKYTGNIPDLARQIVNGEVSVLVAHFSYQGDDLRNGLLPHDSLWFEPEVRGSSQVVRVRFLQVLQKNDL